MKYIREVNIEKTRTFNYKEASRSVGIYKYFTTYDILHTQNALI